MEESYSKIPYFIKNRGCINCDTSKSFKERYGKDYGFDHELQASCLIMGCWDYGIALNTPFIDIEEVIDNFIAMGNPKEYRENVINYFNQVKSKFSNFYEAIGVSLDEMIKKV